MEFFQVTAKVLRCFRQNRNNPCLVSEIDGQVWECTVPTAYAEKYAAAYNTSNLRNIGENQTILRIIGDRPPLENAVRVQPTLEDLYLFYFKGGCEK